MLRGYKRTKKGEAVFDDAKRWDGWGTALKPAHEPIALGRKPLRGTVMANVLKCGTGAINVSAGRVRSGDDCRRSSAGGDNGLLGSGTFQIRKRTADEMIKHDGRWPANVVTDGSLEVLEAFPGSARDAIRFFYSAKAGRDEREFGMDGADLVAGKATKGRKIGSAGTKTAASGIKNTPRGNFHPTVKPIDLMRWLCRLITPPGGTVLDPFMGSGSTGIAAVREGSRFVGIEQRADYFDIARRRIEAALDEIERAPDLVRAARMLAPQQMSLI